MSPFIVTKWRPDGDDRNCDCLVPHLEGAGNHSPGCACFKPRVVSRLAVATLEETARIIAPPLAGLDNWPRFAPTLHGVDTATLSYASDERVVALWLGSLPESGGAVGPLPDGTTIQVDPVTEFDLKIKALASPRCTVAEAVAAFNAKQAGQEVSKRT